MCKLNIRVGTDYLPVKRTKFLHLHCSCFISSVSKSNRSLSPGTVGSFVPTIFMLKKNVSRCSSEKATISEWWILSIEKKTNKVLTTKKFNQMWKKEKNTLLTKKSFYNFLSLFTFFQTEHSRLQQFFTENVFYNNHTSALKSGKQI